jgi:hypothetical protein
MDRAGPGAGAALVFKAAEQSVAERFAANEAPWPPPPPACDAGQSLPGPGSRHRRSSAVSMQVTPIFDRPPASVPWSRCQIARYIPCPPQAGGRSVKGPHRQRDRHGGKRMRAEAPGPGPTASPTRATSRTARRSAHHRTSRAATMRPSRHQIPLPRATRRGRPTGVVGHAWVTTRATDDLPAGSTTAKRSPD